MSDFTQAQRNWLSSTWGLPLFAGLPGCAGHGKKDANLNNARYSFPDIELQPVTTSHWLRIPVLLVNRIPWRQKSFLPTFTVLVLVSFRFSQPAPPHEANRFVAELHTF